jgi:DNA-3-methyladenine glycosylase
MTQATLPLGQSPLLSHNPPMLPLSFFDQPADALARALLGQLLVRQYRHIQYRARIVETEAYMGPPDLASHASKGLTNRTRTLFGPPGHIYVYLIYGIHQMLNITAGPPHFGQAVLIRAAEMVSPAPTLLKGPGILAAAFHITPSLNGLPLTSAKLHILPAPPPAQIITTPRIGIDYAKHWKDAPLRFLDAQSPAVSKRPRI